MSKASYRREKKGKSGIGNELTTVKGIVIPVDWDREGNILVVAISGSDEREYVIEQDEKGKELLKLLRHEIEVKGVVRKAVKGRKTITVKRYKLKTGGNWQSLNHETKS